MTDLAKGMIEHWNETRAKWARSLFSEFPNGLGAEPDFTADGNARIIWSNKGWGEYLVESACLGAYPEVLVGNKRFPQDSLPSLSQAERGEIAKYAFQDAQRLWEQEKAKADEAERKKSELAHRVTELQNNLDEGKARVRKIDTIAGLKVEEEALNRKIESAPADELVYLYKLLSIVQSRMIEIEQKGGRQATLYAWIGIVLAILFGIVSILTWLYPR